MRHIARQYAVLFLCLTLLLAGCSPGTETPSGAEPGAARGRYMEEELTLPDDLMQIMGFRQLDNGTLVLFGFQADEVVSSVGAKGVYGVWTSADSGATWRTETFDWLEGLMDSQFSAISASFVSADEFYLYGGQYPHEEEDSDDAAEPDGDEADPEAEQDGEDENEEEFSYTPPVYKVYHCTTAGYTPIVEDIFEIYEQSSVSSVDYHQGSLLLNAYKASMWIEYPSLRTAQEFELEKDARYGNYYLDGDTFAVVNEGAIQLYDLSSGKLAAELPYTKPITEETGYSTIPSDLTALAAAPEEDALYYCNATGLYRMTIDGEITERMIDGELCSLGLPTLDLLHLFPQQDGSFLMLYAQSYTSYRLFRYAFDLTVASVPEVEISVYSLEDNQTVRQAIGQYHMQNPEARVNYQVGTADSVTVDDALRTLSTELLAGNGPDILVLDGLPVDSYIEKGALADLSGLLDDRINSGELLPNVSASFRTGSGLYGIPARFSVPMLHGNGIGEADSLAELADWLDSQPHGTDYPTNIIMDLFYPTLSHNWLNGDGSLNREAFAADLSALRRMAQEYDPDYYRGKQDTLINGALGIKSESSSLNFGYLLSLTDLGGPLSYIEESGEGELVFYPGEGGLFIPGSILGINSATSQMDLAQRFVEAALSKEVQLNDFGDGVAVNTAALDQIAVDKGGDESGSWGHSKPVGETGEYVTYILNVNVPSTEYLREFIKELEALETPLFSNAIVRQLINDETESYFLDNKSLEETVQSVAGKLDLYMAETVSGQ